MAKDFNEQEKENKKIEKQRQKEMKRREKEDQKNFKKKLKESNRNNKGNKVKNKNNEGYSIFTRIIAAILCFLMVLSVCATLIAALLQG